MSLLRVLGRAAGVLAVAILAANSSAIGATFTDTIGDNFDGNTNMDIASVDVTDDATNITFTVTLNGSIVVNSWGKYVIGIDTSSATGDFGSPVGNPWGRNIAMADGTDAWIGSWVDGGGGGFQPWTYAGGSWTQNGSGVPTLGATSATYTTSLASLGLSPGQTFKFDVYTTGTNGGDSANDSLANPGPSTNNWGGPYVTPSSGAGAPLSYTTSVPEPASVALIGLAMVGGLGLIRRRK